jgi:hypothetical protein
VKGIRRSIVVVLVGIAIFVGFSGTAHAAQQSTGEAENTLTADINQERTSRGLGALTVASDLVAYARQHSADMAAAGRPYHDPNIQSNVQNWQHMGDNVGSGPDADHLHQAFMNSQIHRDEILMPDYTQVGVGAYWAGNVLYVTEVFRLPMQTAAAVARAAAAPRPAPTPRVVVRSAAVAMPAPTAAATTAAAEPTTVAPPTSTSTSLVAAATPPWPSAALNTQRAAATHGANNPTVPFVAVVAALLLMLVAGIEVHALRRRAVRS